MEKETIILEDNIEYIITDTINNYLYLQELQCVDYIMHIWNNFIYTR